MATYKVPNQNLSFNLPDENQTYYNQATKNIGYRTGNQISEVGLGALGQEYAKSIGATEVKNTVPGPTFSIQYADGTKEGIQADTYEALGRKALESQGIDFTKLAQGNFDEGIHYAGAAGITRNNSLNLAGIKAALAKTSTAGESFTQGVQPGNPNALNVTSSTQGDITPDYAPKGGTQAIVPTQQNQVNPNQNIFQQPVQQQNQPSVVAGTSINPAIPQNVPQDLQNLSKMLSQGQIPQGATVTQGGTGEVLPSLQSQGINITSQQDLAQLAGQLGIQNYTGTPEQNQQILSRISQNKASVAGKTAPTAGGTTPQATTPPPTPKVLDKYGITGDSVSKGFDTNPQKTVKDLLTEVMSATGLPDAKKQLTDLATEINDLKNKEADEIAEVNMNPFFSEAARAKKSQSIQGKYESKLGNLQDRYTLLNGIYDDARQEAQFAATTAINLYDKNRTFDQNKLEFSIEQAQKELEAQSKLNPAFELSEGQTRYEYDPSTGSYRAIATKPKTADLALEGQLTSKQTSVAIQLANSLKSHPAYTDMQDIATGLSGVQTGLSQRNGFGDITAINAFQRMVDPGATVREGDVALIQTASAFLDKVLEAYPIEKLQSGAKLPEATRQQMQKTADELYARRAKNYNDTIGNQYKQLSSGSGIPFEYVGQDFPTVATTGIGSAPKSFLTDEEMRAEESKIIGVNSLSTPSVSENPEGFFSSFLKVFGF